MGRTVKIILYYFAYQIAVANPVVYSDTKC